MEVGKIEEDEILNFREVAKSCVGGKKLSAGTVNAIILPLRLILKDAAVRFGLESQNVDSRRLHVARPAVDPFSLSELERFLENVNERYRRYYLIRFLTGMKDSEINGLKWCYVDFANKAIYIRETLVAGRLYNENKTELRRTIHMGQTVFESLKTQFEHDSGGSDFVFSSAGGTPINSNIITNVWYP
jgi:integrase